MLGKYDPEFCPESIVFDPLYNAAQIGLYSLVSIMTLFAAWLLPHTDAAVVDDPTSSNMLPVTILLVAADPEIDSEVG